MEYPVWEIPLFGGGFLIAVIAVVHVFVAHIAVGGGLFLVLTERKGLRENSRAILNYVKRHTRFFLLVSLVFGGLTGVGIWFIISLVSPAATSILIHEFVFAWAIEWVFFLCEIVALLIYHYKFDTMNPRDHQRIGWLYFIFAWLSLFAVNGIVGFMLTPGDWLETGDFWHGIFNPSFWPSLLFRTCMALTLAGLFAFFTAARIRKEPEEEDVQKRMIRYACLWAAIPVAFLAVSGWWYLSVLPEPARAMIEGGSPEIPLYRDAFLWLTPILILAVLGFTYLTPQWARKPKTYGLLLLGFLYLGAFEFTREAARRPYVIHNYIYSTAIKATDAQAINESGMLATAKWVRNKKLTPENMLDAGRELYNLQCLPCHSVNGPLLDILPLSEDFDEEGLAEHMLDHGDLADYMPPFMGTEKERAALAAYIMRKLHGREE